TNPKRQRGWPSLTLRVGDSAWPTANFESTLPPCDRVRCRGKRPSGRKNSESHHALATCAKESSMSGTDRVALALTLALALFPALPARSQPGQPGKADAPRWEFKAVSFRDSLENSSRLLNELAAAGWEYVGYLGNDMAAFRRRLPTA